MYGNFASKVFDRSGAYFPLKECFYSGKNVWQSARQAKKFLRLRLVLLRFTQVKRRQQVIFTQVKTRCFPVNSYLPASLLK